MGRPIGYRYRGPRVAKFVLGGPFFGPPFPNLRIPTISAREEFPAGCQEYPAMTAALSRRFSFGTRPMDVLVDGAAHEENRTSVYGAPKWPISSWVVFFFLGGRPLQTTVFLLFPRGGSSRLGVRNISPWRRPPSRRLSSETRPMEVLIKGIAHEENRISV